MPKHLYPTFRPKKRRNRSAVLRITYRMAQKQRKQYDFYSYFSKEQTREELKKSEYSKKREAKDNLIDILTSPEVKANIIFKTVENLQPCTVADNNILFSLEMGVNTHYLKVPGIFIKKDDIDTIVEMLKNTGDFYCSNANKNQNKKLINALYKA